MNIDAKIFIKILAKWIHKHIQKIIFIHIGQVEFIPWMQGCLTTKKKKKINAIYHNHANKGQKWHDHFNKWRRSLTKFSRPSWQKQSTNQEYKETSSTWSRATTKKTLHLKITLNCERLNAFPCKITDKTKTTTSIQHCTRDSRQNN